MNKRISEVGHFMAQHRITELLLMVASVTSVGLGIVISAVPDRIAATPSFAVTAAWAPLPVWSAVFIILGTLTAAFSLKRTLAFYAVLGVAIVNLLFSVTILVASLGGGIPTGVVAYMGLGFYALVTAFSCTAPRESW